jgi:hypothetical protein
VNYEIHILVIEEVLLMMLILFGIYARRRMVQYFFQRRRRAHMNASTSSSSSVLPVVTAARKDAWEAFLKDKKLISAYRVTPREIESLRNGSLLGSVTCKEDILFILKTVRGGGRRG